MVPWALGPAAAAATVAATIVLCMTASARRADGYMFKVDQFTDVTELCRREAGKPVPYILNEDNPAAYVSVDPSYSLKSSKKKPRRDPSHQQQSKLLRKLAVDDHGMQLLKEIVEARQQLLLESFSADNKNSSSSLAVALHPENPRKASLSLEVSKVVTATAVVAAAADKEAANSTFDCTLHFETELPKGEKASERYDALSMIIVELDHNSDHGSAVSEEDVRNNGRPAGGQPHQQDHHPRPPARVRVLTSGQMGTFQRLVTKRAHYSDRMWPGNNPNFLLSGQLSGFDSIDYRTKVDVQHIVRPEKVYSTFDKPASITVQLGDWAPDSHVYLVVTSYRLLRHGQRCQEHKEFDCSSPAFLSSSVVDHLCMSISLACDGLPNCGQDYLPNQDENCFKIHWSSVLLSLVSYILLAITLLLCLSCFARVLIQWSVRPDLRSSGGGGPGGGPGGSGGSILGASGTGASSVAIAAAAAATSPTGSFRSSSRLFSFLGTTFSGRWERPPPTYDEALKHVNPDNPGVVVGGAGSAAAAAVAAAAPHPPAAPGRLDRRSMSVDPPPYSDPPSGTSVAEAEAPSSSSRGRYHAGAVSVATACSSSNSGNASSRTPLFRSAAVLAVGGPSSSPRTAGGTAGDTTTTVHHLVHHTPPPQYQSLENGLDLDGHDDEADDDGPPPAPEGLTPLNRSRQHQGQVAAADSGSIAEVGTTTTTCSFVPTTTSSSSGSGSSRRAMVMGGDLHVGLSPSRLNWLQQQQQQQPAAAAISSHQQQQGQQQRQHVPHLHRQQQQQRLHHGRNRAASAAATAGDASGPAATAAEIHSIVVILSPAPATTATSSSTKNPPPRSSSTMTMMADCEASGGKSSSGNCSLDDDEYDDFVEAAKVVSSAAGPPRRSEDHLGVAGHLVVEDDGPSSGHTATATGSPGAASRSSSSSSSPLTSCSETSIKTVVPKVKKGARSRSSSSSSGSDEDTCPV